jgi:hypothetical protein
MIKTNGPEVYSVITGNTFFIPQFIQTSFITTYKHTPHNNYVYKMCKAQQMSPFSNITWTVIGSVTLSEPDDPKWMKLSNLNFVLSIESFMDKPI